MPCELFDALRGEVVDFYRWREGEDSTPLGKVLGDLERMTRGKRK